MNNTEWYWPEAWTAPASKNIHSERFKRSRSREISVELKAPKSHCGECGRKFLLEYPVEVYSIQWSAEKGLWELIGKGEYKTHTRKGWMLWFAAKALRGRWESLCQNSRLDVYRVGGGIERTYEYGNRA